MLANCLCWLLLLSPSCNQSWRLLSFPPSLSLASLVLSLAPMGSFFLRQKAKDAAVPLLPLHTRPDPGAGGSGGSARKSGRKPGRPPRSKYISFRPAPSLSPSERASSLTTLLLISNPHRGAKITYEVQTSRWREGGRARKKREKRRKLRRREGTCFNIRRPIDVGEASGKQIYCWGAHFTQPASSSSQLF